ERPTAIAFDLAALHGERDLVAARIAGDHLELRADELVERFRIAQRARARTGRTDDGLASDHISDRLHRHAMPDDAEERVARPSADPVEAPRVIGRLRIAEHRLEHRAPAADRERRA